MLAGHASALGTGLDSTTDAFEKTFNEKLKDGTVKQEQEKHTQMQKAALRGALGVAHYRSPLIHFTTQRSRS